MQNFKYFQIKSISVFILICFFIVACASNRDNIQNTWSHQQNSNTYASHEQQIKITFPSHKWQLYTEQETSPEVIRHIWKKPQYDGDSYNVAIALNPEDDVIIMHLKFIPPNHPVFNDPFENMMIQLANAYKFAIESVGGQVDNFSTQIIQRNNKEIAIGKFTYQKQKNFGAFLGLFKEKDRLLLFEFYILKEHIAARESELLEIMASYERFDKPRQDQLSSNTKQKADLETAESYLNRSKAFIQHQNQYDQALLAFNAAIEIDSDYVEAYIGRGYLFQLNGQHEQAIADYSKALSIQPQAAAVLVNRGETYIKTGQYDKAIFDTTKAIEITPYHWGAYLNRGFAYDAKGQYVQAILDFSKAIEIKPDFAIAYTNRGLAYSKDGQYERGLADINKAIELGSQTAIEYGGRGNVYQLTGHIEQAISDYSKALEISPHIFEIYKNRGQAFSKKNQYDQAISDFNKAIEINPGFTDAYLDRGNANFHQKRYEQAISDYNKAIGLQPKFAMAYNNRGSAHVKSGEYDQAMSDYNHALLIDPESAFISASLAWFLATCPDKKFRDGHKAIEIAQKAVAKSSHPESLASLAAGYAETGKFNEAIAIQTEVINLLKQQDNADALNWHLKILSTYKNHKPWREKLEVR
ncbi:Tfp pilus assembly protein PilF [Nitrosomonas aestuarii]|uniref:Tfp pilus assembly protein PilF n=1 Tax=Nitrosomonas aestuarii TaxID=52441 RepID=A0A1I4DQX7_9PROT|nr:tetratricopeptide repeat protein [Nitrosomonas aestuarii]SFK95403.1 Tfp pilus assembly protein PilF [Nitrosomonas aestuarii]